ncbi:helix-turn-helix transcriptional regulator [Hansschlegelia zhihuaiae]|uniref:Helix-turn-helix transcriptional regulator n=1 Tax=Hansschlegelia zhihuaiae TaxID=405005 RepID=A0A4Q0MHZ7_9HYPH|nr:helix-turn-helix transcriptional regulator [Hansschlegelia zhihuaiae]RXF73035.1 helix-turn-helix transcriptional regulator [Hansschlegelia zhihuaiae]
MQDLETYSALVADIYELSGEHRRWETLLARIAPFVGGRVAQLAVFSVDAPLQPAWAVTGMPRDAYRNFIYRHASEDLRLPFILANQGRVIRAEDGVDEARFRATPFYREMVEPLDLPFSLVSYFAREGDVMATLAVMRGRDAGPFDEEERSRLGLLAPHLRRAFELFALLQKAKAQADDIGAALDLVDAGVFLASGDLRVAHVNRAGEELLKSGHGVAIRAGRLAFSDAAAGRELCAAARRALDPGAAASADHIEATLNGCEAPLRVSLHPLGRDGLRASLAPLAELAVVVRKPGRASRIDAERLMGALKLTPAEAALAASLAAGGSLDDHARERGVSKATVRTQIKALFAKTETSRQGALVAALRENLDVTLM